MSGLTLHFDLTVEVDEDGSATATLNDPGSFDVPLAETSGDTPELAVQALFASVSFGDVVQDCRCGCHQRGGPSRSLTGRDDVSGEVCCTCPVDQLGD
jgi:hypothetical protein